MPFAAYKPPFPLSEHVECFWYVDDRLPYRREKILPTGTIELIVNFGSAYKLLGKTDLREIQQQKHSWIMGLTSHHIITESDGDDSHAIGVRFKPAGACPFLGFPVSELKDRIIEMDLIWGEHIHQVRERLLEASNLTKKFKVLEDVLLDRLNLRVDGLNLVQAAVAEISRPDSVKTIKGLSEDIGISQKHLINQFNKMVGLAPKTLARVIRFNTGLESVDPARSLNWTEIAHRCHYFDQAHFNKDFAAFAGLSPTSYLEFRRQFLGQDLQQGEDVHFVPIG